MSFGRTGHDLASVMEALHLQFLICKTVLTPSVGGAGIKGPDSMQACQ